MNYVPCNNCGRYTDDGVLINDNGKRIRLCVECSTAHEQQEENNMEKFIMNEFEKYNSLEAKAERYAKPVEKKPVIVQTIRPIEYDTADFPPEKKVLPEGSEVHILGLTKNTNDEKTSISILCEYWGDDEEIDFFDWIDIEDVEDFDM